MDYCSIIPPYLLETLAQSSNASLAGHAQRTQALDDQTRRLRHGSPEFRGEIRAPAEARAARDGLQRTIFDARNTEDLPGEQVRVEGAAASEDEAVNQAYDGLGATYALWQEAYGRDSLDGRGLPLLATVHFAQGYDNAFWDGTQMVFGDGDGEIFLNFTRSLDVIGHELAHGVTQYTAGLNYRDQSGALNEHVSDVFGVLVKQRLLDQTADEADWLIGADLLAPGVQGVALRSMKAPGTAYDDPNLGKDPQPDHMDGYVETDRDSGGVHLNSGICNKAFYLFATELGGNAWVTAGQLWYDTLTGDIRADCDFATFAGLTHLAATARHGTDSPIATALTRAWQAVGVLAPCDSDPDQTPPAPDVPAPDVPAPEPPAPEPPDPRAATHVTVSRTGGFAGVVRERRVQLAELPDPDENEWHQLLAGPTLRQLSQAPSHPDAFCYGVRSEDPELDITVSEPELPKTTRELFERTLRAEPPPRDEPRQNEPLSDD